MRVIYNPQAAGGRNAQLLPDLQTCLARGAEQANIELDWLEPSTPEQTAAMAKQAVADGCDFVVSVGGDGTANQVVNGLVQAGATPDSTTLGVIPLGSGNDFAWFAGISLDPLVACQRLFEGRTRVIDLGHVCDTDGRERYFINGCGTGFDATIALEVEDYKWLPGILVYIVPLFKTVVLYHEIPELRIRVDEREWTQPSMLVTIGNGRRLGKGFLVTPDAELDDGLLDVCIGGELSRLGILAVIPRFMRGTHVTHNQVQMMRGRQVMIKSTAGRPMNVHVDGESFATDVRQFEVRVVPGALRLST